MYAKTQCTKEAIVFIALAIIITIHNRDGQANINGYIVKLLPPAVRVVIVGMI